MIEFRPVVLEKENEVKLRHFFRTPEYKFLVQIIDALALEQEIEALKAALNLKQFENYSSSANSALGNAIRFRDCLKVLDEVKNHTDPYKLLKPVNPG
jgi:hypothetical protein